MEVKILGPGCMRCKTLLERTQRAAADAGVECTIVKVEDLNEIGRYVMLTPGLVIDEEVKVSGRVPSVEEISGWLKGHKA